MTRITDVKDSDIGGGGSRTTTTWDNGTSRDVDRDDHGKITTVTDHDRNGNSKSGDGVSSVFNPGGATRINTRENHGVRSCINTSGLTRQSTRTLRDKAAQRR